MRQLPVVISSSAVLRLLWSVQLVKGVFSLEWPTVVGRDERVALELCLAQASVQLPATVQSCARAGARYHVTLMLDPLSDGAREKLDSMLGVDERASGY